MQVNNKPKRGVSKFIVLETGEEVMYNTITCDGEYLVDYPNGTWKTFRPEYLKLVTKGKAPIKSKPISADKKQIKTDRTTFFNEVTKDMPFNCMSCSKPLYAFTSWSKRCVSAHCLPKGLFPSIAENKDNIVFMGTDIVAGVCNCHFTYDASVENRVWMPIYSTVLKRFELLKPYLTSTEIIDAMEYLGIEVTKEILNQLK